jgi:hypothetical protein
MSFVNRGVGSKDLHSAQYTVRLLYIGLLNNGKSAHEMVPAILPSFSSFNVEPDNTVTITHIFDMQEYLEQTGYDMLTGVWQVKSTL